MAQQILNQDNNTMNDTQREIIERAIQNNGKVSDADYERAWQAYNQCLVDKGYNPQPLVQVEGIYLSSFDRDSIDNEELQQKFEQDVNSCLFGNVMEVQGLYTAGKDNPNLIAGQEAAVDCLHRRNLVPESYTLADFEREDTQYHDTFANSKDPFALDTRKKASEKLSFNLDDSVARLCLVANGAAYFFNKDQPRWHPFD
ncbi:hypothetical protein [Bifidobacterium dolichotidis]|nr:hypothetical protein [Bifidobacterium dolichotidis]